MPVAAMGDVSARIVSGVMLAASSMFGGEAAAQRTENAARQAVLAAESRLELALGAGLEGFIGQEMSGITGAGAAWSARVTHGNPKSIRVEATYSGSRQDVQLARGPSTLTGHGVDAGLRINLYPEAPVEPFLFFGAGWTRFSIADTPRRMALRPSDDVLVMPLGFGVAYRSGDLVIGARAGVRVVSAPDLLAIAEADGSEDSATMHRYGLTAHIGYAL